MTDPKIIVAIDTFDFEKANAILEQLNPDHCLVKIGSVVFNACLLYTSPSPRDATLSRMPSSA